jgi:hypothetical protein
MMADQNTLSQETRNPEAKPSARIPYLSKLDEIGTEAKMDEIEGQK